MIFDRMAVIVSQHQVPRHRLVCRDLAEVERAGQHRPIVLRRARHAQIVGFRQRAFRDEFVARFAIRSHDACRDALRPNCQGEIAPVDAQVIAGFGQDRLLFAAYAHDVQVAHLIPAPGDFLFGFVDRPLAGDVEVKRHPVRLLVG
jgi:hypothetical protein